MLTNIRDPGIAQALDPVHARLEGDDRASAFSYTAISSSPVIRLCRDLIDAGHPPTAPMEVYRGDVLALHVRSLEEAAALEVSPRGTGFVPCDVRRRPHIHANDGDRS